MNKKQEVMIEISNKVIGMMKDHGVKWSKPWVKAVKETGQPVSAKNREYTGINRINLSLHILERDYTSPVFATFKQWKSLGANLVDAKGKGIKVFFFTTTMVESRENKDRKIAVPCFKVYTVFNADHVEGWDGKWLEDEQEDLTQDWKNLYDVDELIAQTGAVIREHNSNQAFYSPSLDKINMPSRAQFKDAQGFYGTLFHELIHWTGHESRENRKFGIRHGSDQYAFEELIAELGSAMLSGITGVEAEPREDHAIYLNNWMQCLKDNPQAIVKAASKAEKASQFVLDCATQEKEMEAA